MTIPCDRCSWSFYLNGCSILRIKQVSLAFFPHLLEPLKAYIPPYLLFERSVIVARAASSRGRRTPAFVLGVDVPEDKTGMHNKDDICLQISNRSSESCITSRLAIAELVAMW